MRLPKALTKEQDAQIESMSIKTAEQDAIIEDMSTKATEQDTQIGDMTTKMGELEDALNKSVSFDTLGGVIGTQYIELTSDQGKNAYKSHYTIYKGIDMLADNIAQLPLYVYKNEQQLPADFILPGGFSLNSPHLRLSLNEMMYTACVYFFYRGEFMLYINLEDRLSLEVLNPRLASPQTDGSWRYTGNFLGDYSGHMRNIIIPEEQLVYVKLFNPDGDRGLGPVDVVRNDLLNDLTAGRYVTEFFKNFTQIGGILRDELGRATQDDMDRMKHKFDAIHSSSNNAYQTMVLPKGIRYDEAKQTMKEMQFLDSRKDIRDKILATLGIHKALFGVTDQVNRSVAEEAMRQLWANNLRPKTIRIQEKLNQQLMRRYFPGYSVKFDFGRVDALGTNMESVVLQAKGYRDLGYTLNEVNEHFNLGMEEVGDAVGDMRFVPTSVIPIDDLLLEEDTTAKKIREDEAIDKVLDYVAKEDKSLRASKYSRKYNRLQRKIEKRYASKLSRYFSDQLYKVIKLLRNQKSVEKDYILLLAEIQNLLNAEKVVLSNTMKPVYVDGSIAADTLAVDMVSASATPAASALVVESMVNKIQGINNQTYKLLRNQVKVGLDAGESVDDIAKRITSVYKFNSSRSRVIARTESATVINRTTDERYQKEGVNHKEWLTAGDAEVRDTHSANGATGVVLYDHTYNNGQKYPNDGNGGASENINCRCTIVPVIKQGE